MKKTTLFSAAAISALAMGGVDAALITAADYDFTTMSNGTGDLTAAGFDVINGTTAISGGALVIDHTAGGISDTTSVISGVTDNFVLEGIFTADAVTGPGFDYDFGRRQKKWSMLSERIW